MEKNFFIELAYSLQSKIDGLSFEKILDDPVKLDDDFFAVVGMFNYGGQRIEICLGVGPEGPTVSLPQDLKVNYNFSLTDLEGIKKSIIRCLQNGWT